MIDFNTDSSCFDLLTQQTQIGLGHFKSHVLDIFLLHRTAGPLLRALHEVDCRNTCY
ncbi:hypothetical protein [Pseudomonas sp.]|uniref:hypothetical protein n=1 Tax=Pseudomonas sp. TaxID=306 RepID=UPI0031D00D95